MNDTLAPTYGDKELLQPLRVSIRGAPGVAHPLRGGVTDSGYEEVRGCADILVGRLRVWW